MNIATNHQPSLHAPITRTRATHVNVGFNQFEVVPHFFTVIHSTTPSNRASSSLFYFLQQILHHHEVRRLYLPLYLGLGRWICPLPTDGGPPNDFPQHERREEVRNSQVVRQVGRVLFVSVSRQVRRRSIFIN